MNYQLNLSDAHKRHLIVLSLNERQAKSRALDVVYDFIAADPEDLVAQSILPEGQREDLRSLQKMIFDSDDEGLFIRDGINFTANGADLNPDAPMIKCFQKAQKEGIEYARCDLLLLGSDESGEEPPAQSDGQKASMKELANLMFLHQLSIGSYVDVTKDIPELSGVIKRAEQDELIEIDVKKAGYVLTEKGKRRHASFVEEAQELIKRYDIYCDVDLDSSGNVHFDTGLGNDLRVAVFEMDGIDPFRARFILGLNDGEWDKLPNWTEIIEDEKWYQEVFRPIEQAPSIDDIGRGKLEHIIDRAKAKLRLQSY